ncbi:Aste57867_22202 [Aphanomyces stellatus]|uniref:Aste57867_22202 protein n=1 Tax=Aphanomyces stellatus TaxID=120398 RepID=A0A485LK86_9STRA|nr:hypothetical protein As57867_022133 [Aphanomyces stellatus]VFT98869.1 Aste57867_22202 [Aphanomyces stellatus]
MKGNNVPPPPAVASSRRRGSYTKIPMEVKQRIREVYERGLDWKAVAVKHNVKTKSCLNFLYLDELVEKKRGGSKPKLLSEANLEMLDQWLENDPHTTLEEMKTRLLEHHGITISTKTIRCALDGRIYSFKGLHDEPHDPPEKVREDVAGLGQFLKLGKCPIWVGETQLNLFAARNIGHPKYGDRVRQRRGGTIHRQCLSIVGALSREGFFCADRQRGLFTHEHANEWLRRMLRLASLHYSGLDNVVVIFDNAPCHATVANAFQDHEFPKARFLFLNSSTMNPIENVWSQLKTTIKGYLKEDLVAFVGDPPARMMRTEFRMRFLELCADQAIAEPGPGPQQRQCDF